MAEDKIDSIIDREKIQQEISQTKSDIKNLLQLIQSVKGKGVQISQTKSVADFSNLSKQLNDLIKQTNEAAKATAGSSKAKQDDSSSTQKLTSDQALLNAQNAEAVKLLKIKADIENSVAGSQEHALASIKLLQYQQSILNTTTEAGKRKYQELQGQIDQFALSTTKGAAAAEKQAAAVAKNNEPYNQLVIRFNAAAREAKNLAAQYGIESKQAQTAAKTALDLNNQLKAIDSSIGNHQREVGNYGKALEGAKESLHHFTTEALGLIGIFSVASFFKDSIEEFLTLDKNIRLLQNTLRNIGKPELFEVIEENIHKITGEFKFLKEQDVSRVFNQLILYGKLTKSQIDELLPVIVNFSTATGRELPEATELLIKALQGNSKPLKEFGINMKDAKTPTEGFKLIMEQLAPKVEGVGKAFGESAAGKIAAAKEEFVKLKEEIGTGLIPIINSLLSVIVNGLNGLKALVGGVRDAIRGEASVGGSFLISSFKDNKDVQKEISRQSDQYVKEVEDDIKTLQKLQKEGKKTEVTQDELLENEIQSLEKTHKSYEETVKDLAKQQFPSFDKLASAYSVLKATEEAITRIRGKLSINQGQLGTGDPNKPNAPKPTKEKDTAAELFKQQEQERKSAFELAKNKIQYVINSDSEILNDEKKTFEQRSKASDDYYTHTLELQKLIRDFQTADVDAKAIEDKRKAAIDFKNDATGLSKQLEAIDKNSATEKLKIQSDYQLAVQKLNEDSGKQIDNIVSKNDADVLKHQQSVQEQRLTDLKNAYDQDINIIDAATLEKIKAAKGDKDKIAAIEKKAQQDKLDRQLAYQIDSLTADIEYTKHTIELAEARAAASGSQEDQDAVIAAKQKLAALEIELQKDVTDYYVKSNDNQTKSDEDKTNKKLALLDKVAEKAKEVSQLITDFAEISTEKQLNQIEQQKDAIDKQKEKEIEAENASADSAQDKANKIAIINADAQAKQERLDRRKKQLEVEKAKFDKANSIANIIINTAVAVTKALSKGDVAEAIVVGIIGAASLAKVIATPIPQYKEGTKGKPHPGGLMEVGEGGKHEAILLPDGSLLKSPARSTIMYAPEGTQVFPDYDKMILSATITKVPEFKVKTVSDNIRTEKAINKIGKDIVFAIKNQPRDVYQGLPRYKRMTQIGSSFKNYLDNNL